MKSVLCGRHTKCCVFLHAWKFAHLCRLLMCFLQGRHRAGLCFVFFSPFLADSVAAICPSPCTLQRFELHLHCVVPPDVCVPVIFKTREWVVCFCVGVFGVCGFMMGGSPGTRGPLADVGCI